MTADDLLADAAEADAEHDEAIVREALALLHAGVARAALASPALADRHDAARVMLRGAALALAETVASRIARDAELLARAYAMARQAGADGELRAILATTAGEHARVHAHAGGLHVTVLEGIPA